MNNLIAVELVDTEVAAMVPPPPPRDPSGSGWDWIDACDYTEDWDVVGGWGTEGYDLGTWPYVIYALAHTEPGPDQAFGYMVYVEGDVRAHWYSTEAARNWAVTVEAWDHWQSHPAWAPSALPATMEDLPDRLRVPYRGLWR